MKILHVSLWCAAWVWMVPGVVFGADLDHKSAMADDHLAEIEQISQGHFPDPHPEEGKADMASLPQVNPEGAPPEDPGVEPPESFIEPSEIRGAEVAIQMATEIQQQVKGRVQVNQVGITTAQEAIQGHTSLNGIPVQGSAGFGTGISSNLPAGGFGAPGVSPGPPGFAGKP